MRQPSKKTALITGASRNIGKAISYSLSSEVTDLICCARNQQDLDILVGKLTSRTCTAHAFAIDLTQSRSVFKLIGWMSDRNLSPDILVHNLGGSLGFADPLCSDEEFSKVWRYNVGIGIELNRHIIPKMCERKYGRIVHLSTLSARTYTGNLPYVSAKCALEGYVKTASKHFAKDNVLTMLSYGLVDLEGRFFQLEQSQFIRYMKDHISTHRMVSPEEVAEAVKFLCSNSTNPWWALYYQLTEVGSNMHLELPEYTGFEIVKATDFQKLDELRDQVFGILKKFSNWVR